MIANRQVNELASFLRGHRENVLHKPIRSMARESTYFSQQTLSNYELGKSFPKPYDLPELAAAYELDVQTLNRLYFMATYQTNSGSITTSSFFDLLGLSEAGDHIVFITQRPVSLDEPFVLDRVLDLMKKQVRMTYVLAGSHVWPHKHFAEGRVLLRNVRVHNGGGSLDGLNYLSIDNPDANDFAFLTNFGSLAYVFLDDDFEPRSQLWRGLKSASGQMKWQNVHETELYAYRDWLSLSCGLDVSPSGGLGPIEDDRVVRLRKLEEVMAEGKL